MRGVLVAVAVLLGASGAGAGECRLKASEPTENFGVMAQTIDNRELLGRTLRVVRSGERTEYRVNPMNGGRDKFGHDVVEVRDGTKVLYLGHRYAQGQPSRWDESWQRLADIPAGTRWRSDAPPLRRMRPGEVVFPIVQAGPLKGMQITLDGCDT